MFIMFNPSRRTLKPAPHESPSRQTLKLYPHETSPSTTLNTQKILQGVFLCSDICKTARQVALQCWFSMLWLSVPVLGVLSLLRLRVLFVLFLKLSEPVTHALFFGRSVLFLSRFLSVLNCLLPFCKVLVTIRSTPHKWAIFCIFFWTPNPTNSDWQNHEYHILP